MRFEVHYEEGKNYREVVQEVMTTAQKYHHYSIIKPYSYVVLTTSSSSLLFPYDILFFGREAKKGNIF